MIVQALEKNKRSRTADHHRFSARLRCRVLLPLLFVSLVGYGGGLVADTACAGLLVPENIPEAYRTDDKQGEALASAIQKARAVQVGLLGAIEDRTLAANACRGELRDDGDFRGISRCWLKAFCEAKMLDSDKFDNVETVWQAAANYLPDASATEGDPGDDDEPCEEPVDKPGAALFYQLSASDLEQLQACSTDTDEVDLEALLGVAFPSQRLFEAAVDGKKIDRQQLVSLAKKTESGTQLPRLESVKGCGCSQPWDAVGDDRFTVYGFLPAWLGQSAVENWAVDFSVLDRIGFFALQLNEFGMISDPGLWGGGSADGPEDLIGTVHRYGSKFDLVIRVADNWTTWATDSEQLQRSVESIYRLLLPSLDSAARPDGLVLFFPGYPGTNGDSLKVSDSDALIVEFMRQLDTALRTHPGGAKLALNLLLEAGALDNGEKISSGGAASNGAFAGLGSILVGDEYTEEIVDLLLVFLDAPVTGSKKRLRLAIENEFKGDARTHILRKIMPIISPYGHRETDTIKENRTTTCNTILKGYFNDPFYQLQHDLVYFRDNFRGVALWPMPVLAEDEEGGDSDIDELKKRLVCTFAQSDGAAGQNGSFLARLPDVVCAVVCPNRRGVQAFFGLLAISLVTLALLAFLNCRLKHALRRHVVWLFATMALLVIVLVALVACDPIWNQRQTAILVWLVLVLAGSAVLSYIRKIKQGPLP